MSARGDCCACSEGWGFVRRVLGLTSRPSQVGMEMPMPPVILSSDLHAFEPPDLWQTRIDAPFRDRAPRIQRIDGADQIDLERYLWQPAERRQVGQRSDEMLERLAVSRLTAFRRVTFPRRRSRRVFAAISNRSASGQNPERQLWSVQPRQADARSWELATADSDPCTNPLGGGRQQAVVDRVVRKSST